MKTPMDQGVVYHEVRRRVRTLDEQPDRFINMEGGRLKSEALFSQSPYHRVEFKIAAASVTLGVAFATGMHGTSIGEAFTAAVAGIGGYFFSRLFERDSSLTKRFIDTEPDGMSAYTSEDDLKLAEEKRAKAIKEIKNPVDIACYAGFAAAGLALLNWGASWDDIETQGAFFGGLFTATGTGFFAGKFNTIVRMDRILNKEYAVLPEGSPVNNELKSWAKPTLSEQRPS